MDKSTLLKNIEEFASKQKITEAELIAAFEMGKRPQLEDVKQQTISKAFYYLGGVIIILGIVILLWQHWQQINIITKLLVTLGAGITCYIVACVFKVDPKTNPIAQVFFVLSALLTPTGLFVLLEHAGYDPGLENIQAIVMLTCFIIYGITYLIFKDRGLIIINIMLASWFVISFTDYLIAGDPYFLDIQFFSYRSMALGISYLCFAYHLTRTDRNLQANILYVFGAICVLGVGIELGGYKPSQNIFWESSFPLLEIFLIIFSVYIKNRPLLLISFLFLLIYVVKLTSEYFVESFGWPFALVLAGLAFIVIGYFVVQLHDKIKGTTIKNE